MEHGLGALPQKIDLRDYTITCASPETEEFPETFCVAGELPPVKNQGTLMACVAYAMSSILEYFYHEEFDKWQEMSTNFIYGSPKARLVTGGMYTRDAGLITKAYGDCFYELCPEHLEHPHVFDVVDALPQETWDNAYNQRIELFAACNDDVSRKKALMTLGPLLGAFQVYTDMELDIENVYRRTDTTGSRRGGHAVMIYGWNNKGWLCQNSWGANWGDNGRFILPFDCTLYECWSYTDYQSIEKDDTIILNKPQVDESESITMTNLPITGQFKVTATFGEKGKYWANGHKGVDIVCDNRNIYATCDGVVRVVAYDSGGWGQYVTVGDDNGLIHIFCHLVNGSVLVKKGQRVDRLTKLGIMGNSGNSTGTHLHYQINKDGTPINPCEHLGIPNEKGTYNSDDYQIGDNMEKYKDDNKIANWAKESVYKVQELGIMLGDETGNFNPKNPLTREEAAVIIDRMTK